MVELALVEENGILVYFYIVVKKHQTYGYKIKIGQDEKSRMILVPNIDAHV